MCRHVLPLLFHSKLQSLHYLPHSHEATSHQLVFSSLREYPQALRSLTIIIDDHHSFPNHILNTIGMLANLESLEITAPESPFDPSGLATMVLRCPKLAALILDIHFPHHTKPCLPIQHRSPISPSSPLNVSLTVRGDSTCHISPSVALCKSWPPYLISHLTCLTIVLSEHFFSYKGLLESCSQAPKLRQLTFTCPSDGVVKTLLSATITQLFAIPSLEELILDVKALESLPSKAAFVLQEIIEAAFKSSTRTKALRRLVLPTASDYPLSIKALGYAAEKAIGLESLSLCVNTVTDYSAGAIDPNVQLMTKSTLRHLRICDQRRGLFSPREYTRLAEYLDTIFPNLETLGVYKDSRGVGGFWEEEWELVDHLRRQRKLIRALTAPRTG